jgi:hypothetical protein
MSSREVLDRKERELTKAQEKDKIRNPWMYSYPVFIKVPSGALCLKIGERFGGAGRRTWCDGKRQRVEECLNSFVVGISKATAADLEWKIESERRAREREEEERREEERRRLKLANERKLWALLTEASSWQQSQQIRAYIGAVKDRAAQLATSAESEQGLNSWIAWALREADALDPLASGSYCTREDRWANQSGYGEEQNKPRAMELVWARMLHRSSFYDHRSDWWQGW